MYSSMPYYIPWNTMDCMLDTKGWKYFRSLSIKSVKKMLQMVNQSKLWSHKTCKKCMYSIEIPCSSDSDIRLDKLHHGNDKWKNCTKLEKGQLHEYDTFHDNKGIRTAPVEGFKKIQVHLVLYAVKHDGWHKARLCANGYLTEIPINSVYALGSNTIEDHIW